jgi:DNA repair exonuclease SbcCD ATPase subunit
MGATMNAMIKADEFFDTLRTSTAIGREITKQIDEARLSERKQIAAELAALHAGIEKEFPKLASAADKAIAELREAEKRLEAARQKVDSAVSAKSAASWNYTYQRDKLERELVESASPLLGEFLEWARSEIVAARRQASARHWTEQSLFKGPVARTENNFASVAAKIEGLNLAIESATEARLLADQSGIPALLEQLRAGLPKIEEI